MLVAARARELALNGGIAGGADIILVPEIPYRLEVLQEKIEDLRRQGRNFALVIVAEAVRTIDGEPATATIVSGTATYGGIGHYIGRELAERTDAEVRVTVLGHVQRGGTPVPRDRLMASIFGVHAVDLLAQGKRSRMVAWSGRTVTDLPLSEVVNKPHCVDPESALVHTARGLGISLGDR